MINKKKVQNEPKVRQRVYKQFSILLFSLKAAHPSRISGRLGSAAGGVMCEANTGAQKVLAQGGTGLTMPCPQPLTRAPLLSAAGLGPGSMLVLAL